MNDEEQDRAKALEKANKILAQTLGSAIGFIHQVAECRTYLGFQGLRKIARDIDDRYLALAKEKLEKEVKPDAVDVSAKPGPTPA